MKLHDIHNNGNDDDDDAKNAEHKNRNIQGSVLRECSTDPGHDSYKT